VYLLVNCIDSYPETCGLVEINTLLFNHVPVVPPVAPSTRMGEFERPCTPCANFCKSLNRACDNRESRCVSGRFLR
jgi:hypothetical protein